MLRFFSWIPFALPLPLILLEQTKYEGYRPELADLSVRAAVVAVMAAALIGLLGGRSRWSVPAATLSVAAFLGVHNAIFRWIIPVEGEDRVWWIGLAAGAVAAFLGHLAGRSGPSLGRGWYAVALAALVYGVLVLPEFVRVGAEPATTSFGPVGAASAELPAGRHGVYALWGTDSCDVTADGKAVTVDRTAVPITDNSDSIVAVLVGTIELPQPAAVTASCDNAGLGPAPVFREPLQTLVYGSRVVLWATALLPGLLLLLGGWLSRRGGSARRGSATGARPAS